MGLSPKRFATRVPLMNQTTGSWPRAIETFAVAVAALIPSFESPGVRVCQSFVLGEAAALAAILGFALRREPAVAQ